ncbi:hypothetical protein AJ80_03993 [Polytolypa hystricis UAMH7299]|uniref:Uncharacterized protein n=1 Tax=Polytolypa hystricis (strain UAMH7299) TaxID=1447883 RepID=A0A2B7YE87_POLH7|nr:hypothetical protein AJ80_03993 [Polytolypa hystricis UAMH7299]
MSASATSATSSSRSRPSIRDVPTTARWCNRALRPLTSLLLRLERYWKINPLEGDLEAKKISTDAEPCQNSNNKQTLHNHATGGECDAASGDEDSPDDPTWIPGGGGAVHNNNNNRRVKHKYSTRNPERKNARSRVVMRSPVMEKLLPGEFTIATPLIAGRVQQACEREEQAGRSILRPETDVCNRNRNRTSGQGSPRRKSANALWTNRTWQDPLPEYNEPMYIEIVQGVFGVWEAFLKVTAAPPKTNRGARSLMAMSLDKTSAYILQEQDAVNQSENKEDGFDVADHIFTELESVYGFGSNGGWRPLKDLVRAHGIRLICEAVRRRWVSPKLTRQLVLNSMATSSYDAAESLLSALLSVTPKVDMPNRLDDTLFSLGNFGVFHTLGTFVKRSDRLSYFLRELGQLVLHGIVPPEWVATDMMRAFVKRAIQAVSCDDENCFAASRFLVNVVMAGSGLNGPASGLSPDLELSEVQEATPSRISRRSYFTPGNDTLYHVNDAVSSALSNSISSILTILCGTHIARAAHESAMEPTASSMGRIVTELSLRAQQVIESLSLELSSTYARQQLLRMGCILMSDYLISYHANEAETPSPTITPLLHNFEYFIRALNNRKDLMARLSSFVMQVARCCGRAHIDDGFEEIQSFTEALTTNPDLEQYSTLRLLFGKVAVDVALDFAELTLLPDHHEWAAYIQEQVASYKLETLDFEGTEPLTPSFATSVTGYRWEDGIGEWIAIAAPLKHAGVTQQNQHQCNRHNLARADSPDATSSTSSVADETGYASSSTSLSSLESDKSSIVSDSGAGAGASSPMLLSRKRPYPANGLEVEVVVPSKRVRTAESLSPSPRISLINQPRKLRSRPERRWNLYINDIGDADDDDEGDETDSPSSMPRVGGSNRATSSSRSNVFTRSHALREKDVPNQPTNINSAVPTTTPSSTDAWREFENYRDVEVVIPRNRDADNGDDNNINDTDNNNDEDIDPKHGGCNKNNITTSTAYTQDDDDDEDEILVIDQPQPQSSFPHSSLRRTSSSSSSFIKRTNRTPPAPTPNPTPPSLHHHHLHKTLQARRSSSSSSNKLLPVAKKVVPCSQEGEDSSEDELSFL